MNALLEMMRKRRSVRKYTGESVSAENIEMILQAGLLAPTAKNLKSADMILVQDKDVLKKMADSRSVGAATLEGADAAIVVIGNKDVVDVWCEDCSIMMANMHLMADSLGIGSVWIQGRCRDSKIEGVSTDAFIRELLAIPENWAVEAVLALGMPAEHPDAYELPDAKNSEKVHFEKF